MQVILCLELIVYWRCCFIAECYNFLIAREVGTFAPPFIANNYGLLNCNSEYFGLF